MTGRLVAAALAVALNAAQAQAQDSYGSIIAMGIALTLSVSGDEADPQRDDDRVPVAEDAVEVPSDLAAALNTNAMTSATAR